VQPRVAVLVCVWLLFAVGCADSTAKSCSSQAAAKVCAYRDSGAVRTEFSGFRPGSVITMRGPSGSTTLAVGDQGKPGGTLALLTASPAGAVTLRFDGTAADGTPVVLGITVK
jgi:hypothetical protein